MRKRTKFQEEEGGGDAWLATYGDMITLLMCFFVIFFSVSDVNVALFEDMKNGFKSDVTNTETQTPIGMLASRLDSIYDNPEDDNPDVDVELMKRGINITLGGNSLFGSGSAVLSRKGRVLIADITSNLTDIIESYHLTMDVEGHTDDVPMRSFRFPSNWELSASRAAVVVRNMTELGVPKQQSRAIGFADMRPKIEPRDTTGKLVSGAREINRRVEIIIHY
jgi:chemotaxis protein MotB|tara:strand:+ start:5386 stop:6051 length:666 start_codon:yes stop_codon:yes gene_type:complete